MDLNAAGSASPPSAGAPPTPPNEPDEQEVSGNVTPEEQAQYDRFIDAVYKLIYGKGRWEAVLKRIESAPDKVEALAFACSAAVLRVVQAARQAGEEIAPDVIMHGGEELIEVVAEDVPKFGGPSYAAEEIESAFYRAIDMYREAAEQSGLVSLEAVNGDMQMLEAADQNGELAQVFGALQAKGGAGRKPQGGA
jgi:hypothetical protein